MKVSALLMGSALVLGLGVSQQASAIENLYISNAAGLCQGALPNFEGKLRKRPTAVSNEGTSNAFVSCSTSQNFFQPGASAYAVVLTNNTAASVDVSCTMVAGLRYVGFMTPTLYPKVFTVPAGTTVEGSWDTTTDNAGVAFPPSLNSSCNLPVGVEIGSVYTYTLQDGTAPAP